MDSQGAVSSRSVFGEQGSRDSRLRDTIHRAISTAAWAMAWIRSEDLVAERERLGEERYAQEYPCEFLESRRALVRSEQIVLALDADLLPGADAAGFGAG